MPDAAPVQYTRLPGSGLSRKGGSFIAVARISCRLWLGDDHLLQVESAGGYSESYKRFYFRDIQTVIIQKTRSWIIANIILGFLTGGFLILAVSTIPQNSPSRWTGDEIAGGIFLGSVVFVFGLLLLVNLTRGATCRCYLKTAVHLQELSSLRRYRNAQKILARIRPLIESAQGGATAEMLAPQYAALLANADATPAAPGQFARVADSTVSAYRSRAHQILFFALLGDAVAAVLNIFLPCAPVVLLDITTGAVLAGAVVIALVKQNQTDLNFAVRVLTWITAVFVGIGYITGYVIMIVMAPGQHFDGTQWGYIKAIADLRPFDTPWWLAVLSISAAMAGLLGATGLLLLRQPGREKANAA